MIFAYVFIIAQSALLSSPSPCPWPVGAPGTQNITRTIRNAYGNCHGRWGNEDTNFHMGVDIESYNGNIDVRAAAAGVCTDVQMGQGEQYVVVICDSKSSTHGWAYGHLDSVQVSATGLDLRAGDYVNENEKFAVMAPSNPSIPHTQHLHFSWSEAKYDEQNGSTIDPLDYLVPNNLTWVWGRMNNYEYVEYIEDMDYRQWPETAVSIYTWEHRLLENSLRGNVDILYGYCLEGIGSIGNDWCINNVVPHSLKWSVFSRNNGTKFFTRWVVKFAGELGLVPGDNDRYMQHFFSLSPHYLGIPGQALLTCITNADPYASAFPDPAEPGISNIQEDNWNTLMHWDGYVNVSTPYEALTPDDCYIIQIDSETHDGSTHSYRTKCILDNFYPFVEEVVMYNDKGVFSLIDYVTDDPFVQPHSDERSVVLDYEKRQGVGPIHIDITFSEPVEIDCINLYTQAGDDTLWKADLREIVDHEDSRLRADAIEDLTKSYETKRLVPSQYLGRMVLAIEAHDISHDANILDSDPVTIPYPIIDCPESGDSCYESGPAIMETNIARSLMKYSSQTHLVDAYRYGSASTYQVDYMYTIDLHEVFGYSVWNNEIGLTSSTEGSGLIPRQGGCELYGGGWMRGHSWDPDKYNKVYLVYPQIESDAGFTYLDWDIPFQYTHFSDYTEQELNCQQIEAMYKDSSNSPYPYSCITRTIANYSTGNYCFVSWLDRHSSDEVTGHLSCISSHSLRIKTITYNDYIGIMPGPGEQVEVKVGNPPYKTEYYDPYDPVFFADEAPDYQHDCSCNETIPLSNSYTSESSIAATAEVMTNPVHIGDNLFYRISNSTGAVQSVKIISIDGRTVHSEEIHSTSEETILIPFRTLGMYPGLYYIITNCASIDPVKVLLID
ncbi:hypothetical protein CSA37_01865 [Candidatus Fermentibacteria bacterium]|nr:MAG: hypothetical protein CSA37_01865 [Candidatus Fermentibacteria bacterium]